MTGEITRGAGHLIEDNMIFGHCENEIDLKGHRESPARRGQAQTAPASVQRNPRETRLCPNRVELASTPMEHKLAAAGIRAPP